MTFVEDGRTLGGDTPEEVATTLEGLGVTAIGANCTLGPQGLLDVAGRARAVDEPATHGAAERRPPDAGGRTVSVHGRPCVLRAPRAAVRPARRCDRRWLLRDDAAHIKAVASAVDGRGADDASAHQQRAAGARRRAAAPTARRQPSPSRLAERLAGGEFVVACELPPPSAPTLSAQSVTRSSSKRWLHGRRRGASWQRPRAGQPGQPGAAGAAARPRLEAILTATTGKRA